MGDMCLGAADSSCSTGLHRTRNPRTRWCRVFHRGVLLRAVEARADLVAALRLLVRAPLILNFVGVVD